MREPVKEADPPGWRVVHHRCHGPDAALRLGGSGPKPMALIRIQEVQKDQTQLLPLCNQGVLLVGQYNRITSAVLVLFYETLSMSI